MYLWNQLDYLKERAEGRLVPIEITSKNDAGRSFMSSSWSHKFMGLDEYIESYVMPSNEINDHGYLAQHPLFEQIPDLKKDVSIPIYCNARTKQDYDAPPGTIIANDPLVSAWFGGPGTVSPIHNDPYHNTLAQIVGSKYIRIYDTDQSHRLYPKLNHLGHNSQVDVEAPDYTVFPLFKDTPCWQTILKPGELLYIPRNAWHYVRSLETSFSASFWFGAKMELSDDGAFRSSYLTE
jgi:lysine-specific demethylase 8